MAKYSKKFKLDVVKYYLSAQAGRKRTALKYEVHHTDVRKWVDCYQKYGSKGLEPRKSYQSYSPQFKFEVISEVSNNGLSLREVANKFGLPNHSLVIQWIRQYKHRGIDGLKPKIRGRKPVKNQISQKPEKEDNLKTQAELVEELIYLRAENAYLKKLEALIQQEQVQDTKPKSSQD